MNRIAIKVNVKDFEESVEIILYHKIYSTPEGFVNYWLSASNCPYRLEILSYNDGMIYPDKINKDLMIVTSEEEIASQVMKKIYEQKVFQLQNY